MVSAAITLLDSELAENKCLILLCEPYNQDTQFEPLFSQSHLTYLEGTRFIRSFF